MGDSQGVVLAAIQTLNAKVDGVDGAAAIAAGKGQSGPCQSPAEAGKVGLATTEYVRNLIVRSIQARELQEALADFRAMLAELPATARGGTEGLALEALFEVRAIAAVRDPLIVTNAREEARKELAALKSDR
jgi:hypothetical protein